MSGSFLQMIGISLITMLLTVTLKGARKEFAVLVSLSGVVLLLFWTADAMTEVIGQMQRLMEAANLDASHEEILLKSLGISICTQFAGEACKDAGEGAIGARVELCGRIFLVVLSLPLFADVLALARRFFDI